MSYQPGCIFCRIVCDEAPSVRVHEDELTLAFMDLFPVADAHTLVIPKAHCENLFEIGEREVAAVAATARRVARAIREFRRPDGLAVYQANGAAAGQTVFHYHTHLIPRMQGEPMTFHGRAQAEAARLEEMARGIALALGSEG